nr:dTDP-4-dehydrorhamnose reductase [Saprospiraceae bacterium]
MTKKILITGANGQLGRSFHQKKEDFGNFDWIFAGKRELDITSPDHLEDFFQKYSPDFTLNCAAYTAVDRAEEKPELSHKLNADGAALLAQYCEKYSCRLLHYSTDYVYDNKLNRPLLETDATTPSSVYGKSKLEGEIKILKVNPSAVVVRTSWVYSPFGHNFFLTMMKLAKSRDEVKVVTDQIGTPTYAPDLAGASVALVKELICGNRGLSGQIYNYSNQGVSSWYDFAHAIFEYSNLNVKVIPVPTSEFPSKATRPNFSVLSKQKIQHQLQIDIPHWRDSLKSCVELWRELEVDQTN